VAVQATFAYGGVPITAVSGGYRITRVWAQATIGGPTYVFDPAMKEYTTTAGIDLAAASGYQRSAFMARARQDAIVASDLVQYMNEANVRADLTTYSMNLVNTIQAHRPDATLAQVIGGREIVAAELTVYPTTLPYALAVTGETPYITIPGAYRHTLRVQHRGIDHTFNTFQIAGRRASVFYDAADHYKPVLRVDGTTVAAGTATTPGSPYDVTLTVNHPYAANGGAYADQSGTQQLVSGADYVILHDFGAASADLVASRDRLLTRYVHDGLAETSEAVRGEGLWLIGLTYCYEDHLFARLLGQIGRGVFIPHHLVGWLGQEAGYYINLPLSVTSFAPSGGASAITAHRAYSMMGSALEHGALEQMQGSDREAVSSIKILQLNNQAGNMTFLADAGNWNVVKPHLKHYYDLAFIEGYISAGYTFVLPEYGDINLNQWYGSGYIGYKGGAMGMWVEGAYAGGWVSRALDILIGSILDLLKALLGEAFDKIETEKPKSGDPVDMFSGALHVESLDLTAGPDGLLDLAFGRSYSSGSSYDRGPLGYGWSYNQQTALAFHHDYRAGLGQRQPTDAAALILFAQVILDVLEHERNIQGWMTADLAAKWAMDQLIDNAVTAHFGTTTVEYIRLADGSHNPPPGIHWRLRHNGDYHYAQGPDNTCMIFDAQGRGRVWADANGNTLTYTYDGAGRLLSVASPTLGQSLAFTYTGDLLTAVADPAGRAVAFEYTGNELTTFRDAEGHAYTYAYDSAHRLVSVTRPRGNTVVTNVYDDLGRVQTQTDALGHTTTFYFSGFRNAEMYADGGRMAHYFNAQGQTIGNADGLGQRTRMTYDGLGRLRTLTDRLGDTVTYTYDPASGQIAAMTNPAGKSFTNTYAALTYTCANPLDGASVALTTYNLSRVDYADGSYETLAYDSRGNLSSHTDLAGQTWQYQHNARGQQTIVANPSTALRAGPAGGQTTYTYHANGALASSADSDTGVTTYGYDGYLRRNRVTYPGGSFIQTTYDRTNRVTSLTDERGQTTTYEYDANGNLVKTTDPLGQETTYVCNLMDQVTQETNRRGQTTLYTYDTMNRLASVTDPNGHTTQYRYDSHGWLTQVIDPAGHTLRNEYNAEGLHTAAITPLGHTVTFQYDSQGRLLTTTDPLGHQTNLTRDALGRITASADPGGRTTRYTYDALGRTTGVTLPGGETTAYSYNSLGLLSKARDPRGQEWSFAYSLMGRLQSRTDPLGHQWAYTYNQRGFLTQVAYPTGDIQTLTYDRAGNLTRQQYSAGPDLSFVYDESSRLVATNEITLTYDEEGQVIATTDHGSRITNHAAYDAGGRLASITYAAGLFTVTYQYNSRDLLTRVSDDLTGVNVQFTYDDDGRLIGAQRSNGVHATFAWDAASRLTRIQEGALIDLQYTHDAAGEVIQAVMSTPLDLADYLVTDIVRYTYDAASQISSPGFAYDAQGRLTADPQHTLRPGSGQAYTWDGASRLVGVGQDVILSYNGLGDLLTRMAGGQTTRYLYNRALRLTPIVAEQDANSGQYRRFYVWTPGGALLYMIDAQDGNRVYFYHFDRTGSTLALTNQVGNPTDVYAYDPFGRLLHHQGGNPQPFTYVGEWGVRQEGDSGVFYHMRARYYDALTGRFISREPLWPQVGNAQAINPYQYAYQNPAAYVDMTGRGPTPAEYARWRMAQAGEFISSEEASRITEDINRYANEWVIQNVGDPTRFELTPEQFGRLLVRKAGEVIDEKEQAWISEKLNVYTNEWTRRNVGDPDKYELTPEQYARWLIRNAGEVIDEDEAFGIWLDVTSYEQEWFSRRAEKYELTPEEYARWLMKNAGEVIDESEAFGIWLDVTSYEQEWVRHQSAKKVTKYLMPAAKRPRRFPQAHNARQPIRLGGYYGLMP
jgi:RHS repeat-associated protein